MSELEAKPSNPSGISPYRTKYRHLSYAFRPGFIGYGASPTVALVEFTVG